MMMTTSNVSCLAGGTAAGADLAVLAAPVLGAREAAAVTAVSLIVIRPGSVFAAALAIAGDSLRAAVVVSRRDPVNHHRWSVQV